MKTLFISNEKRKILFSRILSRPEEPIQVRKLASELGFAPGFVSSFVKTLRENGFVKDGRPDLASPQVRAWKIVLNMETLSPLVPGLLKHTEAHGAGVYGSFSKGTNNGSSDLDIWIIVPSTPTAVMIAQAKDLLRQATGREISLLVLTPEKSRELRKSDPSFYYSLSNSFVLGGEQLD